MKTNLLLDLSYLFHRTLNVMPLGNPFENIEKESQFIRKIFIDIASELRKIETYDRLIVCKDSSSWRKDYDSTYKGNREKDPESLMDWNRFYDLIDEVSLILEKQNCIISKIHKAEADDLIYLWSDYFYRNNENVIILTADRDLYQCVKSELGKDNHIVLINNNSMTRKIVCDTYFEEQIKSFVPDILDSSSFSNPLKKLYNKHEKLIVNTNFHVFSKILEGDSGDNIEPLLRWITDKGKNRKVSPGISKNVYENLPEKDFYQIYQNDSVWNTFCINFELYTKNTVDRNKLKNDFIRNLNLVYLHSSTIPKNIQDEFSKQIEKEEYIKYVLPISLSSLEGTIWEKKIEIKSDIFAELDMSKYDSKISTMLGESLTVIGNDEFNKTNNELF